MLCRLWSQLCSYVLKILLFGTGAIIIMSSYLSDMHAAVYRVHTFVTMYVCVICIKAAM